MTDYQKDENPGFIPGLKKPKFKLPKLFFTKDTNGNPVIVKGKKWHVYFSYLQPGSTKYKLFKVIHTLNKSDTVEGRMITGRKIVIEYTYMLENLGFNPFRPSDGVISSSLESYTTAYMEEKKLTLAENTYNVYVATLKLFIKNFTDKDENVQQIVDITKNDIKKYAMKMAADREWQAKTFNDLLSQLGQFFDWIIYQDNSPIDINPVDKVPRRPVTSEANPPLNEEVFASIMKEAKEHYPYFYIFYRVMYYSCLRPIYEMRLLKVGHIDVDQMMLHIPVYISKTGKSTGKGRSLPMASQLLNIFTENNIIGQNPDFYVFTLDMKPGTIPLGKGYFNKQFRKIRETLKLEDSVELYAIKHTRVCHLVIDGVPLYRIQELTGHTTLEQLMVYLKGLKLIVDKKVPIFSRDII